MTRNTHAIMKFISHLPKDLRDRALYNAAVLFATGEAIPFNDCGISCPGNTVNCCLTPNTRGGSWRDCTVIKSPAVVCCCWILYLCGEIDGEGNWMMSEDDGVRVSAARAAFMGGLSSPHKDN